MTESTSIVLSVPFIARLIINAISLIVLVRGCYYRKSPNTDFLFSFYLFGMGVFIVTFLLHNVNMSMGFAFGLFAVFAMLRYRTESISIKEMTYLFLVITIALLSAVGPVHYSELLFINGLICGLAALAESSWLMPQLHEKMVHYDKIENIKPENRAMLLDDLKQRIGLNVHAVRIESIDFLKDSAYLKIYFTEPLVSPQTQPSSQSSAVIVPLHSTGQ